MVRRVRHRIATATAISGWSSALLTMACATWIGTNADPASAAWATAPGGDAAQRAPAPAGALDIEDRPEPLVPRRPRSETEHDRVLALARYAAGHSKQQRGDGAAALRDFQRAWQCDPTSKVILRDIVSLADELRRYDEASRYALKFDVGDPIDPSQAQRLGIYLLDRGDWAGVLKIYRMVLAEVADKNASATLPLRMEMGRLYFVDGQYKESAAALAEVFAALEHPERHGLKPADVKSLAGDAAKTYRLFGESFLLADRPAEAAAAFAKAHQASPNQALLDYRLARIDARGKKYADALAKLRTALDGDLSEDQAAAYVLLAEVLTGLGKRQELVERLENLYEKQPRNVSLGYSLASAYRAAGNLDRAEPLLARLLETRPTLDAYRGLVDIYRRKKQPERLLDVLDHFISHAKPPGLDVLEDEAKALAADDDAAAQLLAAAAKRIAASDKVKSSIPLAAALVALERKQFDAATKFFEAALAAQGADKADVLRNWGLHLLAAERYDDAARRFRRAIDDQVSVGQQPMFYFLLAGALEAAGKTDAALDAARKAAELQKTSPRYASRVAWVNYHAKSYDEAARLYAELLKTFDGRHTETVRETMREARLVLSNIAVHQKDFAQAEEWLAQVLDEFPDDVGAMNDLGYLWADQGKRLPRALDMIQRAVAAEPDNMAYRDSLGWALYRVGRFAEAVVELERAAKGDHVDGVIFDHLGDACLKANQKEKAIAAWQRAATAFEKEPDDEKLKTVREKLRAAQRN